MRKPGWRAAILGGTLLGIFAFVLVRIGVALLLGGVRVLVILGVVGLLWVVSGALRRRP